MLNGLSEYVSYSRTRQQNVSLGAMPVKCIGIAIHEDDTVHHWEVPVLGVITTTKERYSRRRQGESDDGDPFDPPTARSLLEQGYHFDGEFSETEYLIHDPEMGPCTPEWLEKICGNVHYIVVTDREMKYWLEDGITVLRSRIESKRRAMEKKGRQGKQPTDPSREKGEPPRQE